MLLEITGNESASLRRRGFLVPAGTWAASEQTQVELPAALHAGFDLSRCKSIGAFTYSWSKITSYIESIGRYCSIAKGVSFGAQEHEISWLSTSSFTYDPDFMGEFCGVNAIDYDVAKLPDAPGRQVINIGNDVWIGADAFIKGGVTIGDGAVIGARALVTKNVEPYAVVGGLPAKKIGKGFRFDRYTIDELVQLKWWNYAYFEMNVDVTDPQRAISALKARIEAGTLKPYSAETISLAQELPIVLPANFSAERYLILNRDVAESGMEPADHYIKFGHREGRRYS